MAGQRRDARQTVDGPGFAGRARSRRADPQSPDAALALALERLRRGRADDVLEELAASGEGYLLPTEVLAHRLRAEVAERDAAWSRSVLALVRLKAELGSGDRGAAAQALADAYEDPLLSRWRSCLHDLGFNAGLKVAPLDRVRRHLASLQKAQDMPRRGEARLAWLAVLIGGLGPEDRPRMEAFDRRMARGRNALKKAYRYDWTLDDCHTRRYLTQFGFADRRADGGAFWRAEPRSAELLLTPKAAARVRAWWAAGPNAAVL